jgi:anti-sigma factor RsiW
MSCSPFDLRDYFFKELPLPQQLQVEAHVNTCVACQEEMERLQATGAALFSLREEEIPQRIGFVSDKIFEPSPMRRWFTAFWGSTARLGFASALVLSVAMSFSAWRRSPAPAADTSATVTKNVAVPAPLSPEELDRRIQAAVVKAVADVEARITEESRVQLAEYRREADLASQKLRIATAGLEMAQRRAVNNHRIAMVTGGEPAGELK